MRAALLLLVACASPDHDGVIVIDLRGEPETKVERTFDIDGERSVHVVGGEGHIVEAFATGGSWFAPRPVDGPLDLVVEGSGDVTMTVWARGPHLPAANRDRSLAWFDAALLDDRTTISFGKLLSIMSPNPGVALERWFRAFAAGPGAGRATFAQFLDEVSASQGADASKWNLETLPFKVTGIHNRVDLANSEHCGELRVSVASTHATLSPVHFIFLFRQPAVADVDITPDGTKHCRGTARAWARLSALDGDAFAARARDIVAAGLVRDRFLLAESVELSLSPWQWRQWTINANGDFVNPALFQTIDIARVNSAGPLRDQFLADVAANAPAIAARTWPVPNAYRSSVAEVQPNTKAPLVDLGSLDVPQDTARKLGMIGCPRCHTDDADFLQTNIDRTPSPFYDRELDARAARLDALGRGETPPAPPFGPLQPF